MYTIPPWMASGNFVHLILAYCVSGFIIHFPPSSNQDTDFSFFIWTLSWGITDSISMFILRLFIILFVVILYDQKMFIELILPYSLSGIVKVGYVLWIEKLTICCKRNIFAGENEGYESEGNIKGQYILKGTLARGRRHGQLYLSRKLDARQTGSWVSGRVGSVGETVEKKGGKGGANGIELCCTCRTQTLPWTFSFCILEKGRRGREPRRETTKKLLEKQRGYKDVCYCTRLEGAGICVETKYN